MADIVNGMMENRARVHCTRKPFSRSLTTLARHKSSSGKRAYPPSAPRERIVWLVARGSWGKVADIS
jgi:hypothetical protein